ncbi:MAG: MmcQ/YjbR family DNA-binding protein [Candidatus Saccharibacteria bacterium]
MITHKEVEDYLLSMPNARLDYPFGEDVAVYKVGDKMFAIISEQKQPVNLSLKCDPELATVFTRKVRDGDARLPSEQKALNTLVLSGELPWEEVQALIKHSYRLVSGV